MAEKFHTGDAVLAEDGTHKGSFGIVMDTHKKQVLVDFTCTQDRTKAEAVPASELSLVPPVLLSEDELRQLCRFELMPKALRGGVAWTKLETKVTYEMTLDDFEAAFTNILAAGSPDSADAKDWYETAIEGFADELCLIDTYAFLDPEGAPASASTPGLPSADSVERDILDELYLRYEAGQPTKSLEDLIAEIESFKKEEGKPLCERTFTTQEMEDFLAVWDMDKVEREATPEIRALYVRFVNALADAGDPAGLYQKAYACYGNGSAGFSQDWAASRDCLLKLEKIAPDPGYANTLGYIYYYGRTTDGVPDYQEAFKWFSIGAAGGIIESRYKLADMFVRGRACPKDPQTAHSIVAELFNDSAIPFSHGQAETKFADVCLREAGLLCDGTGCIAYPDDAYALALLAKCAIRMRRLAADWYGDASVERNIDDMISELQPKTAYAEAQEEIEFDERRIPELLSFALMDGRHVAADYEWDEHKKLSLSFHIKRRGDATRDEKFPVAVPEAHFGGFVEELTLEGTVKPKHAPGFAKTHGTIVFDEIGMDPSGAIAFLLYGETQACLEGTFTLACTKLSGKKRRYAAVITDCDTRAFIYLAPDDGIQNGDHVLVPWGDGTIEGICARTAQRYDSEMGLPKSSYRKVLKKVEA